MTESGSMFNQRFFLDKEAFESIYRSHWRMVFGVCFRYLKDEEIAKELVQDIFESLWRRKNTVEIHDSIDKYLAGAAKLAVFNHLRNVTRQPELSSLCESNPQISTTCTEEEILCNNLTERVVSLSDSLPEKSREVFEMSRNQGLSNKEIAISLLISENTVKYHIAYALRFFKTGLKEFI
jgi:RNA polymerase sigma-70 factor (family 1)